MCDKNIKGAKTVAQGLKREDLGKNEINVQFFGDFQVASGEFVLTESSARTGRPWSLLQFLLLNRHKSISRQQIMDAMWPGGQSAQPEKALKNLVYRLRSLLLPIQNQFEQEAVLSHVGSYRINSNLPWVLDFEEFEKLCLHVTNEELLFGKRMHCCKAALKIYQGEFLSEHVYEEWVLPYSTHFHFMYLKCIQVAVPLFGQAGMPEVAEQLCIHALALEKFEESIHIVYMQLLIRQGKRNVAAAHYERTADIFIQELGVMPCTELRVLYNNISASSARLQTDLTNIKESMSEKCATKSAFVCDYEIFRQIYRLEERQAERGGDMVSIGLMTLCCEKEEELESDFLDDTMRVLLQSIHASLRRGDVVARFSQTQYVLMLPTVTMENGTKVLERVAKVFQCHWPHKQLSITSKIQPLALVQI